MKRALPIAFALMFVLQPKVEATRICRGRITEDFSIRRESSNGGFQTAKRVRRTTR
jgi:hypothetical protein